MKDLLSRNGGYTLIEILAGVTIVTMVTVSGLYGIQAIGIGKVKLIEKTRLEQQAFYFSERLFELIKASGTLDYEEYFNRQNVGNTSYLSGHFDTPTGFGNRSSAMIYCLSGNSDPMGSNGCITSHNTSGGSIAGDALLYGTYAEQFIDYNSDFDANGGDEDGDGNIKGDDDDRYLGDGPDAFDSSNEITEVYLINGAGDIRTFFRWFVREDPFRPTGYTCDFVTSSHQKPSGDGCLGTMQFLRLIGKDWGENHIYNDQDTGEGDGVMDTWIYDTELYGLASDTVADLSVIDSEGYRLPVFADDIHLQNIEVYAYPHKDANLAWADTNAFTFISPYLRISMTLVPSWKNKRKIKGDIPSIDIDTTINLTSSHN